MAKGTLEARAKASAEKVRAKAGVSTKTAREEGLGQWRGQSGCDYGIGEWGGKPDTNQ